MSTLKTWHPKDNRNSQKDNQKSTSSRSLSGNAETSSRKLSIIMEIYSGSKID